MSAPTLHLCLAKMKLNRYPKARQGRFHGSDPAVHDMRWAFLRQAGISFLMLQVLFLVLFCYIFGSLFQQAEHQHNLNILFVDYDNGAIGQSINLAYNSLKGNTFPTIQQQPATQFPTPSALREAICKGNYWAALYVSPGTSTQLSAASSDPSIAATYNRTGILTYIWDEVRYPTYADSLVSSNLQTLSNAARIFYTSLNYNSTDSISILSNPWILTSDNIKPTVQGSRVVYNTMVIVLMLIQEFFYLATINGLYQNTKIYERLYPHRIILYRNANSGIYTLCGSLCTTGAIWAFKAGWAVNGAQFVETWMLLWLFAHVNFLALDFLTIVIPPPLMPMGMISWVVLNITSVLIPFELSPGFYRWGYALPAHEVYTALTDIWSGGCYPKLHIALPVLFAWEVVGLAIGGWGVYRRCHYAKIMSEKAEVELKEKVDKLVALQRKREKERERKKSVATMREVNGDGIVDTISGASERKDEEQSPGDSEREEIEEEVRRDTVLRREETASSRAYWGPSFELGLTATKSRAE